jgi:L-ascorbate metabolism protein UlaG (beta-lactamase superfamily)
MQITLQSIPRLLYKQFWETQGRYPAQSLPVESLNSTAFPTDNGKAKFIWYGHSAVLMRMKNKTLLIDPMLGPDSSPTAPFRTKRFSSRTLEVIDQIPPVDLMLITHDHYDHLDYASIQKLKTKTSKYYVALGVARHLVSWGIPADKITEFDWWDSAMFDDIEITFTPARHFSGRGLTDRFKSLWGGWSFHTPDERIYFSGDGGYGDHFKEIGQRLGPFDFGLMECGQYNELWHQIHMFPEESVQAAKDVGARSCMPVHWAAFALAPHQWKDPAMRFAAAAEASFLRLKTPALGQLFTVADDLSTHWWNAFD